MRRTDGRGRVGKVESSYNGWPASPEPTAIGIDSSFRVAGVAFPGGCKGGDVALVLGYVASLFNQHVEQLVDGWCWGYDYRYATDSPEALSCHASGTALDLNAPHHPRGASFTFLPAQVDWIEHILRAVGGVVRWGGAWGDEMHFEIAASPDAVAAVANTLPPNDLPPPLTAEQPQPPRGDDVTEEEIDKIAAKVWSYMIGGGGAGATLKEIQTVGRANAAKLSELVDPRNGNVNGTG
jgi:hypothetical protein